MDGTDGYSVRTLYDERDMVSQVFVDNGASETLVRSLLFMLVGLPGTLLYLYLRQRSGARFYWEYTGRMAVMIASILVLILTAAVAVTSALALLF